MCSNNHLLVVGLVSILFLGPWGCATKAPHGGRGDQGAFVEDLLQLPLVRLDSGTSHAMSRERNVPIVATYFASWCIPCMEDMPILNAMHQKYGMEGLRVVGIGLDLDGMEALVHYADYMGLEFPVFWMDRHRLRDPVALNKIKTLPTTLFIDRQGRVEAYHQGPLPPVEAEKAIQRLLKKR